MNFKIDLFKALHFLRRSWSDVKQVTIANCFRKAGFVKIVEPVESLSQRVQEVEEDELNDLWEQLAALDLVEGGMGDYLAVDNQLVIGEIITLANIASDVLTTEVGEPEAESDSDVMEVDEELANREAREALQVLQRYSSNPMVLQLCDKVDDLLAEERMKNLKQKSLLNYFVVNK